MPATPQLIENDYDALFAAMKPDMPRTGRNTFPTALAQLEGVGAILVTVTETVITVSSAHQPEAAIYRVSRPSGSGSLTTALPPSRSPGRSSSPRSVH